MILFWLLRLIKSTAKSAYQPNKNLVAVKPRQWQHVEYEQEHVNSLRQYQQQVMFFIVFCVFQHIP